MCPHQQIETWLTNSQDNFQCNDRPFVTLSYAQSLDGSIAMRADEPLALSGPQSLQLTHQLRSIHDGILVGIGTVLSDNPQLSVRHWSGLDPQPIVLDSKLRMPASARLCHLPDKRCWVLTTHQQERAEQSIQGLEISTLEGNAEGRVCLQRALKLLRQKGISSLMVEGGANVINAFLKARLADALVLTLVPKLIGGYKAVNDLDIREKSQLPTLAPLFSEKLGEDLVIWGSLQYGDAA
ncbi:MAG TPA: RibD family protein [Cellvibrio sp.]|nr:RibD family protein [Cellvibrio sp.]